MIIKLVIYALIGVVSSSVFASNSISVNDRTLTKIDGVLYSYGVSDVGSGRCKSVFEMDGGGDKSLTHRRCKFPLPELWDIDCNGVKPDNVEYELTGRAQVDIIFTFRAEGEVLMSGAILPDGKVEFTKNACYF